MKHFLFLLLLFPITVFADTYVTTNLAIWNSSSSSWKYQPNGSGIVVTVNNNVVTVSSRSPQIFVIYSTGDWEVNSSGHFQLVCYATDQDGHYCTIRIVERPDYGLNCKEIYIYYNNIVYLYEFYPV